MKKIITSLFVLIFIIQIAAAQQAANQIIYLWPGGAPGFESKKAPLSRIPLLRFFNPRINLDQCVQEIVNFCIGQGFKI